MRVCISIVGGNQAELESLDAWLRGERELSGRITVSATAPAEGELGALGEALVVAVSSGGALSVLAASLKAWISLPHRSDIHVKVESANGQIVEIDAARINGDQIDQLIRHALASANSDE
ncbi:MAG: hypothetical protein JO345_24165 [Streptosporangiaceae bacterium]|nr:hypothetical protein [Streptosporangiaceae bacterium]